MNGGSTKKAVERCRDEILRRIEMREPGDFERARVASEEVISEHVRAFLKFSIDKIEKLVREKLRSQG